MKLIHMGHIRDYSETTASAIDAEIRRLMDTAYKNAETILMTHMDKLHQVAKFLFDHEKMSGEEFEAVMTGNPVGVGIDPIDTGIDDVSEDSPV